MLTRTADQALHFVMEAAIGLCVVLALAACTLAWRLAQGPIDLTALVQREQALFTPKGDKLSIGSAALAWEGFVASDQPLDIRLQGVRLTSADGSLTAHVKQARVTLSISRMLLGQIVPRTLAIDGASVQMLRSTKSALSFPPEGRSTDGPAHGLTQSILRELAKPVRLQDGLPWLSQLRRVDLSNAQVTIHDATLGVTWEVAHVGMAFQRLSAGGVSGLASADLAVGTAHATMTLRAELGNEGTHIHVSSTPLSPASLAANVPALAGLAAADLPLKADFDATLGQALAFLKARLEVTATAGTIKGGGGTTGVQSADVVVVAEPSELMLESARIALAAPAGKQSPPVLNAQATATLLSGRLHATFALSIPAMNMGDLGAYWPPQIGRASRGWLVKNIVAGRAHDAHVEGALDSATDLSDLRLSALSGAIAADDVSLYWLRPIPPLTHGHADLMIEGPDAMRIIMNHAEQDQLDVLPGSMMEINGLQEQHQAGNIDVRIGGKLESALALLNHPRLQLLTRSGLDFAGASGQAQARLLVHLPLEDTVTMDDIKISSTATLTNVHLGKIAANRDLDGAQLGLKVDNDSLQLTGHGAYAGIPTDLTLDMDFRAGAPEQVIQHVTALGMASSAEIASAGLPAGIAKAFPAGTASIKVDYAALRNHTATLLLDADLKGAELQTPFGWKKAAGSAATAGARLIWDHGQLASIDHLRAQGPGLLIASHARLDGGRTHTLVMDSLVLGQTRASGEIGFPTQPADPLIVTLSGPMLDLSAYFRESEGSRDASAPAKPEAASGEPEKPGQPWAARLQFSQITLAKGEVLAPFRLNAASDGLHISHAALNAGAHDELSARIISGSGMRTVSVTSPDAGVFLRAVGVADNLGGGHLQLDGVFADSSPGDPLTGKATLENFTMRQAPAIGRLLQAMTLYGLSDVLRGPGLHFSRLVAPFRWQRRVLYLQNARAFSPSLGLTAAGTIDIAQRVADMKGTIVPAYFFNQLLGDLPVVGRIFSPEKGGGVFAARYSVTGRLADPKVGVNPLSALTPGFLREVFGLLSTPARHGSP